MHREAYEWVRRHADPDSPSVLDIGGRDINGSVRDLFPGAGFYLSLDLVDGPGVDLVADAATWQPDVQFHTVVCCEVFEHTPHWPQICHTAFQALRPGGELILTTAGPGRPVHSGVDGGSVLKPGEHYANIDPGELRRTLVDVGFVQVTVDWQPWPSDVRAYARRPDSPKRRRRHV